MVLVSYSGREINAKLVYYGPGLSGKTTNLEYIYSSIPQGQRGKMVSMKTKTERTLFFDFLPVNLGELSGFKTRFLLYTVPGQVYYNATRKLVLKGVDGVVFVADSKRGKMDENVESLENLKENLREHGLNLGELPWVIQYNKRDLPDTYSIEELEEVLNPDRAPSYEAVATNGQGVVDTFKGVSRLLLRRLAREIGVPVVPAAHEAAPSPAPEPVPRLVRMEATISAAEPESPAHTERVESAPAPALRDSHPPDGESSPAAGQPFWGTVDLPPISRQAPTPAPAAPPPEPTVSFAPVPETEEETEIHARGLSVSERLRRWLSRSSAPEQEPLPAAFAQPPAETAPLQRDEAPAPAAEPLASVSFSSEPVAEAVAPHVEREAPEPAPEPAPEFAFVPEAIPVQMEEPLAPGPVKSPERPAPVELSFSEPTPAPGSAAAPADGAMAPQPVAAPAPELLRPSAHQAEIRRERRFARDRVAKPREIIVPLSLEPADLETGIVLRIAIQAPWFDAQEESEEEEDRAA